MDKEAPRPLYKPRRTSAQRLELISTRLLSARRENGNGRGGTQTIDKIQHGGNNRQGIRPAPRARRG